MAALDVVKSFLDRANSTIGSQIEEIHRLKIELIDAKSTRARSRSPRRSEIADLTNGKGHVKHVLYDLYNKKLLAQYYVPTDAETETEWQDRMMRDQCKEWRRLNEVFGGVTVAQYVKESRDRAQIVASNTADRAAEALGLVAANTVIRTTVEADMRAEIVKLKADVTMLKMRECAFESEIEDLIKGDGRIADVFHANWVGEREVSSEDEEGGERDLDAETREERRRLDHELQGTTVRQFLGDVVERLQDLSLHVNGVTSSYMRRPR